MQHIVFSSCISPEGDYALKQIGKVGNGFSSLLEIPITYYYSSSDIGHEDEINQLSDGGFNVSEYVDENGYGAINDLLFDYSKVTNIDPFLGINEYRKQYISLCYEG